jgi:hypothetical protein
MLRSQTIIVKDPSGICYVIMNCTAAMNKAISESALLYLLDVHTTVSPCFIDLALIP